MSQEHQTDFAGFNISYDNYHSTHSEENRQLSELIYSRLKENGFIKNRTISAVRSGKRHVPAGPFCKGTCPKCKSRINTAITAKSAARPTARLN